MKSSDDAKTAAEFQLEEGRVEQRSAVFKKELGLTDLALTQILFIVGLPWIGVAAKQGPSHVVLWLLAILNTSEIGLQVTQYIGYIIGPSGESLTSSKWFIGVVNLIIIGALVLLTTIGLGVGKWVHK